VIFVRFVVVLCTHFSCSHFIGPQSVVYMGRCWRAALSENSKSGGFCNRKVVNYSFYNCCSSVFSVESHYFTVVRCPQLAIRWLWNSDNWRGAVEMFF